jgi:excisionase family DNA binding protein
MRPGDAPLSKRDWYSGSEAAGVARCSTATLYRAIRRGKLASQRVDGHRRIPKAALREWAGTLNPRHRHRGLRPGIKERESRRRKVADLQAQGLSSGRIARRVGAAKNTVVADLEALGLAGAGRSAPRKLPPAERAMRAERAEELYSDGCSVREIAARLDSSRSQISLDLAGREVQTRPAHRPADGPPAEERPCEGCGRPLLPRYPSDRDQRFHGGCVTEARAAALEAVLEGNGLLGVDETAERLMIVKRHVHYLRARGELVGELVDHPMGGGPVWGVSADELWRWELARSRSSNTQVAYWGDPERAVEHLERTGALASRAREKKVSVSRMRGIELGERLERRRRIQRHKRGLKPGQKKTSAEHLRWWEAWQLRRAEVAYHQERLELGLVDASDGEAYEEAIRLASESERGSGREVMLADWRVHLDYWDRAKYRALREDPCALDPKSVASATDLVCKAIKALQNKQN